MSRVRRAKWAGGEQDVDDVALSMETVFIVCAPQIGGVAVNGNGRLQHLVDLCYRRQGAARE